MELDSILPMETWEAWHPEFAAVERTTELRARASAFNLSEDEVKAAVKAGEERTVCCLKVVNDFAKSGWDKAAKAFRSSEGLEKMKKLLQSREVGT